MDPSKHTDGDPSEPPRPPPPDGGGPASYPGEVSSSSSSPRPPPQQQQRDATDSQRHMRADAPLPSAPPSPSMASSSDVQQLSALDPPYPTVPDPSVVNYGVMARGDASSWRQQQLWPIASSLQQFGPQLHGYRRSEPSSSGGYAYMFDAAGNFLAKPHYQPAEAALRQRFLPQPPQSGPQFLPQPPQSGPQFLPQPPQSGPQFLPQLLPQSEPQFWPNLEPPMYLEPRLEEIRLLLLRSPMMLGQLVVSRPDYSEILVHQLDLEDETMRRWVLNGFSYCAHRIMENRHGHPVFEALLRSFHKRYRELSIIVQAAVTPHLVLRSNDGVTSLRMLIKAVAGNHDLSAWLVERFVCEFVMDFPGGHELILHCFTTMPYEVTMALVQHAMADIDRKLASSSGSRCLATCFRYAAGDELPYFQDIVRDQAIKMAKLRYGTYFVRTVIDHGSIEFRKEVVLKLMQDLVPLSRHHYGIHVVHHCFLLEEAELLPNVLRACADLPREELQALAMRRTPPNLVLPLHRLLQKGNTDSPKLAKELAQKINLMDEPIRKHPDMKLLMSAVTRVLADKLAISAISLS